MVDKRNPALQLKDRERVQMDFLECRDPEQVHKVAWRFAMCNALLFRFATERLYRKHILARKMPIYEKSLLKIETELLSQLLVIYQKITQLRNINQTEIYS